MNMRRMILTLAIFALALSHTWAGDLRTIIAAGDSAYEQGRYATAIDQYYQVLDLYRRGTSDSLMARAFNRGGNACTYESRYIEALEFYTMAIETSEKYHKTALYAACTSNIGTSYAIFKDYERAIFYFEKALQAGIEQQNAYNINVSAANLVLAYSKLGNAEKARQNLILQQKYPMTDAKEQQYHLLYNQGQVAIAEKKPAEAMNYMREALHTIKRHQLQEAYYAEVYNEMAHISAMLHQPDSVIAYSNRLMAIARKGKSQEQLFDAYKLLTDTYEQLGMRDSMLVYQSLYLSLSNSIFNQQRFNEAKDRLARYENNRNNEHIFTLNDRINTQARSLTAISLLLFLVIVFAIAVFLYNRRLQSALRLLVTKNEELIVQNEKNNDIRDKYLALLAQKRDAAEEEQADPSGLNAERREQLLKDINQVFEDKGVISDTEFSLHKLAELTHSNTKYVSVVINDAYGKNFKTVLNEYRIREASKRLANKEQYGNLTIQAIAEEVGYNSTNNFIIAFKKVVGMTPSVYRRQAEAVLHADA